MTEKQRRNIIFSTISIFIFSLYYFLSVAVPPYADDYTFQRLSLFGALQEAATMYFSWGGRVVGYGWTLFLHGLPHWLSAVCTAASVAAIIVCIHLLGRGAKNAGMRWWQQGLSLTGIAALFWFCLPDAMEVTLWRMGASYSQGMLCACLLLLPCRWVLDGEEVLHTKPCRIGYGILAGIAAFTNEIFPFATLFLLLCCAYALRRQGRAVPAWLRTGCIALLCGGLLCYFAPGNFVRAGQGFALANFLYTLFSLAFKYAYTIALPALGTCFLALLACRWGISPQQRRAALLLTGACLLASGIAAAPLIAGGAISYRALSYSFLLMLLAFSVFFVPMLEKSRPLCGLALLLSCCFIFSACRTIADYSALHTAQLQRDALAASALRQGDTELFVPELPAVRQANYFFADSLRGNPAPWVNADVARHYGLKNIWLSMADAPQHLLADMQLAQRKNLDFRLTEQLTVEQFSLSHDNSGLILSLLCHGDITPLQSVVFLTAAESSS